jgi:hypothetical protein
MTAKAPGSLPALSVYNHDEENDMVITMETSITQGGFPFERGRSYRVHQRRGANLIAGGDATAGAAEGATITEAPAEDLAYYGPETPIVAPEQISAAVIAPETASAPPETPAKAPEPEEEGIGGAEALTGRQRRGKLGGTALSGTAQPK